MVSTADRTESFDALSKVLDDRWSCRQFRPEPVSREVLERLLRLAQRTPSWSNTQPWQVVITEGAGTDQFRKELLAHAQSGGMFAPDLPFPTGFPGAAKQRRRECGEQLYASIGITKDDREATVRQMHRNFEFFDAPHVAIVSTEADLGVYGAIDCGLYINTLVLGAHSLGLAATPQASMASYSPFIREYFGLPDTRKVVVGISLGYPDTDHPVNSFRTSRAPLDEVVTWRSA